MNNRYYNALVELAHALHLACSTMYPSHPEEVVPAEAVRFELEVIGKYKPIAEEQREAIVDALALLQRDKVNMTPVFLEYYQQYYEQRRGRQHRPLHDKTRLMLELAPRCYQQWQGLQLGDSAGSGVQRHSQGDLYPLVHMQQGDKDYLLYAGKRVPLHKQLQGMLAAATEEERVQYVLLHGADSEDSEDSADSENSTLKERAASLNIHPLYLEIDADGKVWCTDGYYRTPAVMEQLEALAAADVSTSDKSVFMRIVGVPHASKCPSK